ncbi:MAG: hypothetical protein CVU18_06605 [Betaproteobacteria bacterium HGW-Betaproteobacteria-12]|nr:MAG: hypothetical protein CVU18_06605 [Betaproteobacteria bacterium HGW-Betaproteobacteria-12]
MVPASLLRRLTFTAVLSLVAGIGLAGWPFKIDVWDFNQLIGLALVPAIPLSIIWAGFGSPRMDVRVVACIVALPVLSMSLLCWFFMSLTPPFVDGLLDEARSGVTRYRLYRVVAFDSDPLGILLQREIDLLPGLRIYWKICGDTYESAGKITRLGDDEIEVRAGERLVLSCRL